eukprot:TRINITY_DN4324_c0_g1_i10.p1 TRINITY_DN4324_c0_g1~~TRINITY_DN4324_c0_g1_i10.p1  ORF type:complete len:622 (-),score=149.77 TRINITY_DN4324_c0_g1_i10:97-1962(-)
MQNEENEEKKGMTADVEEGEVAQAEGRRKMRKESSSSRESKERKRKKSKKGKRKKDRRRSSSRGVSDSRSSSRGKSKKKKKKKRSRSRTKSRKRKSERSPRRREVHQQRETPREQKKETRREVRKMSPEAGEVIQKVEMKEVLAVKEVEEEEPLIEIDIGGLMIGEEKDQKVEEELAAMRERRRKLYEELALAPEPALLEPTQVERKISLEDEKEIHELRARRDEEEDKLLEGKKEEQKQEQNQERPPSGHSSALDMFASTPAETKAAGAPQPNAQPIEFDDEEQYYISTVGEVLDRRWKVIQKLGKGQFASVVRAVDVNTGEEAAIKILRSRELILRHGEREKAVLEKLNETDKQDRRHIVRLLGSFEHRRHLCLVFESLDVDLRETIRRFGKNQGLSLEAVRSYARQLFSSLLHMKKNKIIHADLKPDNILVSSNKKTCKVCDFNSAIPVEDVIKSEDVVSRFYRAPEIILGAGYGFPIDVWATGCTLFEMYTGEFLFPGRSPNHMLKLMMLAKGRFPHKLLKKGEYVHKHFDEDYTFLSQEIDPVTRETYVKRIMMPEKPTKEISAMMAPFATADDQKTLKTFVDFLEKCLALDPSKRLTPEDGLSHPFIRVSSFNRK